MATKPNLIPANAPLPDNWKLIDEPPIRFDRSAPLSPISPASSIPGPSPYFAASIPLTNQLIPDIMPTRFSGGLGGYRIMPPLPSGSAAVNSAIRSIMQETVIEEGIDLEVNGVPNPVQNKLNLTGAGVSYGPSGGQVAITSGGGATDQVVHGDPLWEADPGFVELRDDFYNSNPDSGIMTGQMSWAYENNVAYEIRSVAPPCIGVVSIPGNTTAGQTTSMISAGIHSSTPARMGLPLADYPSWKLTWVFYFTGNTQQFNDAQLPTASFAKKSFYVGLAFSSSPAAVTFGRPPIFVGLRFDTDTTSPSIADTTFHFECVSNPFNQSGATRNNAQGNTFDTGISPAFWTPYRLEITCTAAGIVTMSLNGSSPQTLAIPTYTANDGGGGAFAQNGFGTVFDNGTQEYPWGVGSIIDVTATPGSILLGNHTCIYTDPGGVYFLTGTPGTGSGTTNVLGFPSLIPFVSWGNSNLASPPNDMNCQLDFFSLLWNPGVNPANALTPNPTLPRYW